MKQSTVQCHGKYLYKKLLKSVTVAATNTSSYRFKITSFCILYLSIRFDSTGFVDPLNNAMRGESILNLLALKSRLILILRLFVSCVRIFQTFVPQ